MKRIFIVAIAASLLVSCSSKEISLDEPNLWSRPLVVQSSFLNDVVTTRGSISSGSMGVFRIVDNTKGYTALNNVQYTYGDPSWTTAAPIYLNGSDATIIGYYPYNNDAGYSNYATIPLVSKITSDNTASSDELCYQKTTVNNRSASVKFSMNYAYAKVVLNITKTSYSGTGSITNITFNNTGIYQTGKLNMNTNSYTSTATGKLSLAPSSLIVPVYDGSNAATTVIVKVLMIPCTLTDGKFSISLTVDGLTITSGDLTLASLEPAKQYTYNLDLTGTATGFAAVTCADWDEYDQPLIYPIIQ